MFFTLLGLTVIAYRNGGSLQARRMGYLSRYKQKIVVRVFYEEMAIGY